MPFTSLNTLIDSLCQSGLLSPQQCGELTGALQKLYAEPEKLAAELVRRGWMTDYQFEQLSAGLGRELVIGPYIVLDRIGQGGMGQVFKARHQQMARVVALKVIRPERLGHPEAVRRFEREAKAAARLDHPNIVTV
jgi:serine/threonine protein kinase